MGWDQTRRLGNFPIISFGSEAGLAKDRFFSSSLPGIKKLAILLPFLFLAAPWVSADTVTMFESASESPIAEVGLALCPTTQACHQSLANAIASFDFSPPPGGGEYGINASNPAFAAITGYLEMTDQQIAATVPYEALVPFFWNAGPDPGSGTFFTQSNPNLNYYLGHFGIDMCVIDGVTQPCGYPIAGRQIDSLSVSVSAQGEMLWQASGVDLVPEPSATFWLLFLIPVVAWGTERHRNRLGVKRSAFEEPPPQ